MAPDAVVIGAGPNGLVAANVLADAGWSVLVLEAADQPGGAVRTGSVTAPGFRNDLFSAFYPLTAASPVIADLHLERHGLCWTHAPKVLAHPRNGRPAVILSRDLETTAASVAVDALGDAERYRAMYREWCTMADPFMHALLRPFPPVRDAARLVTTLGGRASVDLARLALLPLRRFAEEHFDGDAAALLLAGNALHADLTPDTSGSALFGWLLVCLGQQHGFPVPVGGAGAITAALVERAQERGVVVQCGQRVRRVDVVGGQVRGVTTADGTSIATRTVLADCDARTLMLHMVGSPHLPAGYVARMRRFQRAAATFKLDWAVDGLVPWSDPDVVGAGTVHIADDLDELTLTSAQIAMRQIPSRPFMLVGQMTTADASRSPAGTESLWAYTHVPQDVLSDAGGEGISGRWGPGDVERFTQRMEARIEEHAPGFTSRVIARSVMSPLDLERANANLVGGDISGGTAQLHQQLVFRPLSGMGRAETPITGLFLASASAHPGGAVHGACGANAARAALLHHPGRRLVSFARKVTGHLPRPSPNSAPVG